MSGEMCAEEEKPSSLKELQSETKKFGDRLEKTRMRANQLVESLESSSMGDSKIERTMDSEAKKPNNRIQEIQNDIIYFDYLVEEINKSMLYLEGVLK